MRKHNYITPVLQTLHWLNIPQKIQSKILLLKYKVIHDLATSYLIDLITKRYPTSMSFRSSSKLQHAPGPRGCIRYDDRAFSVCAPALLNNLPAHIQDSPTVDTIYNRLKLIFSINTTSKLLQ